MAIFSKFSQLATVTTESKQTQMKNKTFAPKFIFKFERCIWKIYVVRGFENQIYDKVVLVNVFLLKI